MEEVFRSFLGVKRFFRTKDKIRHTFIGRNDLCPAVPPTQKHTHKQVSVFTSPVFHLWNILTYFGWFEWNTGYYQSLEGCEGCESRRVYLSCSLLQPRRIIYSTHLDHMYALSQWILMFLLKIFFFVRLHMRKVSLSPQCCVPSLKPVREWELFRFHTSLTALLNNKTTPPSL